MTSVFKKIGYLSGPVQGRQVIEAWYNKADTPYFGTVYLKDFCEVVTENDAEGVVVTFQTGSDSHGTVGKFRVFNIGRREPRGFMFHVEAIRRMLAAYRILRREKVDFVVLTEGSNYWFTAALLRWSGIEVVASLHCRIWSPFEPLRGSHRLLHWLNAALFYKRQRNPFMGVSQEIGRQVVKEAAPRVPTFLRFFPTYPREMFAAVPPPPASGPFTILSAGRIEANKGVLDLVDVAAILRREGYDARIHLCGVGTAMKALKDKVQSLGLEDRVIVHGSCGRSQLLDLLGQSHVVVVPTRTDFEEGFAKTCAEGVLAGRPVVTSRVCPALEDIRDAAVEVEPNDVDGYAHAFKRLIDDPAFYEAMRAATGPVAEQFLDPANSYGAALRKAIAAVAERVG